MSNIEQKLERLFATPNKEDILHFLGTQRQQELDALYQFADHVRRKYMGDAIHLRGIIEFSNCCKQGCRYCGLNQTNHKLNRYRMEPENIVFLALQAYKKGFQTVVLQSGEDPFYDREDYLTIIKKIKEKSDMVITLSIGEKDVKDYRAYFLAGAHRFLLKHETSDPTFYKKLHVNMDLENRLNCLKNLKAIGYQAGSGIMIGLPGQTLESMAEDIMLFKELDIDMIGCGPFIPHPDTPLHKAPIGSEDLTYRILALNRIVTRNTHLPATTALSTLNEKEGRKLALQRGANVIMPNLTPWAYRRLYEIYPNKKRIEVSTGDFIKELNILAASLGRFISSSPGHRGEQPVPATNADAS